MTSSTDRKPLPLAQDIDAASAGHFSPAIRLARAFCGQLALAIPEDMPNVIRLQVTAPQAGICRTHDFCDANMLMDAAFTEVFGRPPVLLNDAGGADADDPVSASEAAQASPGQQSDQGLVLWNQAWDIAVRALYQAESCRFYEVQPEI